MLAIFHAESVCRYDASLAGAEIVVGDKIYVWQWQMSELGRFRCNTCARDQDLEAMNLDKSWLNAHFDSNQVNVRFQIASVWLYQFTWLSNGA